MTTEEFIQKAKAVHGDKYNYSKVEYVNNRTKVVIICPEHGEFLQAPYRHLRGYGCHNCGKEKQNGESRQRLTQNEVIKRIASKLEGTPYELVLPFAYQTDRKTRLKLRCTIHNETWEISWHSFMYRRVMTIYEGCTGCRQIYSKEDCAKAAKLFSSRSEFAKYRPGEYAKAMRLGCLDEICAHMQVVGNHYKRCIYAYVFEQADYKHVYVGLTGNMLKRDKEHRVRPSSAVNKFAKQHHIEIPPIQQMTDYLPKAQASIREGEILQQFLTNGYLPINIQKTGGLGGHLPDDGYTYEQCQEKALCYRNRSEWKEKDYSTYYVASKYGWIDTIMPQNKPYGNKDTRYWTIERCCGLAKGCATISEFREKYPSAYTRICKSKWNDIVFANIKRLHPPLDFDLDTIKETLKRYSSTASFAKEHRNMVNWLFHHKYKMSDIATPEQLHNSYAVGGKAIVQCDMDGNFVAEYNSAREPVGFDYRNISACCHGLTKSHKGYKWFFKKDYEQIHQNNIIDTNITK